VFAWEPGSADRIMRMLFRERYETYTAENPGATTPLTLQRPRRPRPVGPAPGPSPAPSGGASEGGVAPQPKQERRRPRVSRYAAPEPSDRWRRS
jgi:hypothetical protein